MIFRTCPYCGASLDPCERCDCQKEKTARCYSTGAAKVKVIDQTTFTSDSNKRLGGNQE